MLRRTILLGLAPAVAAGVCVLTAVRSPAADPLAERQAAEKAAAGKPASERPGPAAGGATMPSGTPCS